MAVPLESYVTQVRRVLWLTLAINIAVVAIKLTVGLLSSSLAILSDAGHSAADSLNNVMGLLLMSYVRPYADPEHPYGHTKFEVLGAIGIASFMLLTFYEIISHAIERFIAGSTAVQVTPFTVAIFAMTIAGNIIVIWYERSHGLRLKSQFLLADSRHTQTDLYVTIGVVAGLILVALGFPLMDTIMSLLVAGLVAFTAYQVVRDAIPVLVDQALYDTGEIQQVVGEIPGVAQVEEVRTRGAGAGCFIELTICVSTESLHEAHHVADDVEQTLQEKFGPDCTVTVHVEPAAHTEEGWQAA